jgi:hypothetical protein
MRPLAQRLARFGLFAVAIVALGAIPAAQSQVLGEAWDRLGAFTVPLPALGAARLTTIVVVVLLVSALAAAVAAGGRVVGRRLRHAVPLGRRWPFRQRLVAVQGQLRQVRFELVLPRDALAEPYEVAKLADGLAPILRSQRRFALGRLLGPDSLVLDQHADGGRRTVAFHAATTARAWPAVQARMRATYPGMRVIPAAPDPLLTSVQRPRVALASRLRRHAVARVPVDIVRLKKRRAWVWSLQTTRDFTHSAVSSLVHQLHGCGVDATVQLVLTPTPARAERRAGRVVRKRERDLRVETGQVGAEPGIESVTAQKDLRGAVEGVGRAYYWFDLRIVVPRGERAVADAIGGALAELRQDNELRAHGVLLRRRLFADRARNGLPPLIPSFRTGALSAAEVASCWHLPSARVKDAGLRRVTARRQSASGAISHDPRDMLLVDDHGPVGIAPGDRRKGLAVIGAPGAGKSSLLLRCIGNAARDRRRALVVIDLKEDLARDALSVIPPQRRVHLLDLHRPRVGVNPLAIEEIAPEVRADMLIAAIREIHGDSSVGARSDSLLRAATTAVCVAEPTPTLAHVQRMLDPFDAGYRAWVSRELGFHTEIDSVRDFWLREFPAMLATNPRFVVESVAAPRNKLQRFLDVPALTLATNHPVALDLMEIVRDRGVLVINGSKQAVGEDNAAIFCQLVVLLIQRALHRIQALDRTHRTPCTLVIDEAHNIMTPSFATLLAEGRSAWLEPVVAFQHSGQILDERVRSGVQSLLQNVSITRTRNLDDARAVAALAMDLYSDAISANADDQRKLAIDPLDIAHAPDHQVQNLWLADGAPQPVFTADTVAIEPLLARIGDRAREHHEREQVTRGYHPHDHGKTITPPLIWDAEMPVLVRDRHVRVDLTGWAARPSMIGAEVTIALSAPDGPSQTFAGRACDASMRRYGATIPRESSAGGLPAGTYRVVVRVVPQESAEIVWSPTVDVVVDARKRTIRRDPVTIELGS